MSTNTRSTGIARALVALLLLALAPLAAGQAGVTIPAPSIPARSFVLVDHATGAVLAERNADERVEPASITKIMTVYVAAQALRSGLIALTDETVVSEKAWKMEGSRMFIEVGKRVTVDQLLDGIIVQSGNDASVALAEHVSGSEDVFAGVMNKHARELGMTNSSFANATGLPDPGTYVTARDIATLSSALIREFPEVYARFAKREYTFNDIRQPNRNRLLARDDSVDGIKTGHTESAGFCLVSSAARGDMRLVAAVMGTESDRARTEASAALLNYGFRFYETRRLYAAGETVVKGKVWRGDVAQVRVGTASDFYVTLPRGRYGDLAASAELDEPLTAPLAGGQVVGRASVRLDGEELAAVDLTALDAVAEGSFFSRLYDDVMLLFE
ncbi:MAG: D-alanyl-D-alanine carboxypeptidase family protein [Gammaproteobacteria bacterium]